MYALVMSGEIRSVTIGRLRRVPARCLSEYVDALLGRTEHRPSGRLKGTAECLARSAPKEQRTEHDREHLRGRGRALARSSFHGFPRRRAARPSTRLAKTEAEVIRKVRDLEKDRDAGRTKRPGRAWTVEKWLDHWLENIAAGSVRPKTYAGYQTAVRRHLIPGIGGHRTDRLQPEHIEKLYAAMRAKNLKPGTVHHTHRTLRAALNEAVRRGQIVKNPVVVAKPPRLEEEEIEPLTVKEAAARPSPDDWPPQRSPLCQSRWRSVYARAKRSGCNGPTSNKDAETR